ncbi:MAG: hypothetical protein GF333_05955 [Candidatus Omnitrophica bacterium]|nr:hypothetical protein [Candidatus Omnitrophota bacterium]
MKKWYVVLGLILWCACGTRNGYSEKITVVFTGNTFATLYPCKSCSAEVGGGIARRATRLKELREEFPDLLLIESGNFTAGGDLDRDSLNPQMDKARTLYYAKALELMEYDAVGVGTAEFHYGPDFLRTIGERFSYTLLSANVRVPGVRSYVVRSAGGIKVAILGITPRAHIYQEPEQIVEEIIPALKNAVREARQEAEFLILISPFGDQKNTEILESFPEIPLIISSGRAMRTGIKKKVGESLILRPAFEGKELRYVHMEVRGNRILDFTAGRVKLPLSVEKDPRVSAAVPSCFHTVDCPPRKGLVPKCEHPGGKSARCVYQEAEKYQVTVVKPEKFPFCSVKMPKKFLGEMLPGAFFVDYTGKSPAGRKLIRRHELSSLPAFLLPEKFRSDPVFPRAAQMFEQSHDAWKLKKEFSGVCLLLNREPLPKRIDFFLHMYDPQAAEVLKELDAFRQRHPVTLKVHFILPVREFPYARQEAGIARAVQEKSPDKFIPYLLARMNNIDSLYWTDALREIGADPSQIGTAAKTEEITRKIARERNFAKEIGVTEGNVILLENNKLFKTFQIREDQLREILFSEPRR